MKSSMVGTLASPLLCRAFMVVGLTLALLGSARAAITLTLNTTAKTLFFSGSDTGTPLNLDDKGFVGWKTSDYTSTGDIDTYALAAFSTSATSLADTTSSLYAGDTGFVIGIFYPKPTSTPTGVITFIGDPSQIFNYGDILTLAQQANLEAIVASGQPIAPSVGSNLSPINTVPEPSPLALLATTATVAFTLSLRRRLWNC